MQRRLCVQLLALRAAPGTQSPPNRLLDRRSGLVAHGCRSAWPGLGAVWLDQEASVRT